MLAIKNLRTDLLDITALEIGAGECVAIVGPSGSGKSLFLRAVADLDPNRGEIALAGVSRTSISAPDWRRRVGMVPAESGWWADIVGDHIDDVEAAGPLMEQLGLPHDALGWSISRLSTGERQRLAIVRALIGRPKALLLDEPSAALDPISTGRLEDVLQGLLAEGVPMILVTHDPAQAGRLASRTLEMRAGRLSPMGEEVE